MKTVRADLGKSRKTAPKKVFGGTRFFTIFWTAKKLFFEPQMGQNASEAQARERQEIGKNGVRLLRQCYLVLGNASGHAVRRF